MVRGASMRQAAEQREQEEEAEAQKAEAKLEGKEEATKRARTTKEEGRAREAVVIAKSGTSEKCYAQLGSIKAQVLA